VRDDGEGAAAGGGVGVDDAHGRACSACGAESERGSGSHRLLFFVIPDLIRDP
jgi:hypothetical protein